MKVLMLLASLGLCSYAAPAPGGWQDWNGCLTDAQAADITARQAIFLGHQNLAQANATAQGLIADNIVEYGDSINSLIGDALGTIVESNKQHYIADTLSTPPFTANTLDIVHNCNRIVWHWEFIGIGPTYRVRGFTLSDINSQGQIEMNQVEFNSIAWGVDEGFTVTPPAS